MPRITKVNYKGTEYDVGAIDATLTQSGQAADAKAVGDAVTELKNDLEEVTDNYFYLKPQNKFGITITMPEPEVYNVNGSATGGMYINLGDGSSIGLAIPAGTYTFKVEYLDSSNIIPAASLGFYYNTSNNTGGATYVTRGTAVTLTFNTTVYIFFRLANNGTTYSDMKFRAMVRRGTSAVYVPHRTAVDGIERSLTETPAFVITNNPDNFIEWNSTSKVLTVKRNGFVVGKNAMHSALSAQSVDFSSISTTNNAYRILVDINGTVHGKAWNDDAESNMFCIGLIYDSILYISGVNNFAHENIAMVARGMQKTAYIAWDSDIKTITVSTGTFIIGQNGAHHTLKAQTADFSSITTTYNAYRILVDSSGYIHGKAWTDDTDTGMLCIGMTYGNNVEIFGATDDTMSSKQKVYFFGDSIVAGVGSPYLFHMMLGLIENVICYNWGVGSTGYVATTSDSVRAGKGVIGRGGTSQESGGNTILDIMTGKEFTSCVIFGGTNDYGKNIPLAMFRTAVQNTLDYALQKTNNILVITPLKRYYNNIPYTQVNSAGYTLSEYSAVIKEECEARAIGYVDGFNISLDPTNALNNSRLFADGLHPNEAGHERIAGAIRSAFEENCMVLL